MDPIFNDILVLFHVYNTFMCMYMNILGSLQSYFRHCDILVN